MDPEKTEEFKKKLLDLRERLTGEVSNLEKSNLAQSPREQSGDLSGYSIHLADSATDSYEREISLSLVSRGREVLNAIDRSLEKIEQGTYGKCERCPGEISEARLDVIPYARLCVRCKEREEKAVGRAQSQGGL